MHKFEINRTNVKGGCESGRKVVTHNSKSDLPLGCITSTNRRRQNSDMLITHATLADGHEN